MQSTFWHVVTLAAAVFLFGLAPAAAAQPARAGHADTEQEIRAVRAVYQEVTQAIAANRLTRTEKTVRCHNDPWDDDVTVWTDASGRVRQLTIEGGTDDHAETLEFYYDSAGRLRFIFASRGAVNMTGEEERVYYAADRRVLRRVETLTHGPGYPFSEAAPIWRPAEWLRNPCAEDH